jgi:nucleobase:cation symporter-1, NCS1 family
VLAIIWYAIGAGISTSAVSAVLNSLTLMLYLLVPWTALNLVDFFFVRHGHYAITDIFRPDGVYGAWGWRGLTAAEQSAIDASERELRAIDAIAAQATGS